MRFTSHSPPVTANERLKPGQHVGFVREHNTELVGVCSNPIGIVDPFLEQAVERGQRCYIMLYQNTVTGMRHQWEHPAFVGPTASESERWLQDLAIEIGKDYHSMLDEIADGSIYTGSEDMSGTRDSDDICRHYERATGQPAPSRGVYFRCAC